jgi:type IV pilus biogenesis protein CpaD/CtpE
MRTSFSLSLIVALTAAVMGCAHNTDFVARLNSEPLPTTNQSNIAAMVANPADLVRGHGGRGTDAVGSVLPIDRLEGDKLKALQNPGGSSSSGGGGSGG